MKFISNFISKTLKNEFILALIISLATYLIFIGKFLLPNYYFWGSDATYKNYPTRFYFYERIYKEGSFPFWTERQYLGFPIYADAENGYLNPINVLSILIFGPALSYKILHLSFYLIGSLCLYLFLKKEESNLLGFFIANTIYFFSTYLLNHQIHFNITLFFYLLPAGIYLVAKYIENSKFSNILLLSIIISFSILFGQIQPALIFCLGIVLYYLIFNFKKILSFQTLFLVVCSVFLIGIQTLPQIIPSFEMYDTSVREDSINMYNGSLIPVMTSFTFLPYVFGDIDNYQGVKIKIDYSYTEIYLYVGISVFFIFIWILLFNRFNKLTLFAYITFWIFLVFSTLKYNQIFTPDTPIVSLFRYWERVFILTIFGIAVVVAKFISEPFELYIDNIKKRIWLVLGPLIYIIFYQLTLKNDLEISNNVLRLFAPQNLFENTYLITAGIILGVTIALLLLASLNSKQKFFKNAQKILKYLLVSVVFLDLFYFSFDVVKFRLQDISNYNTPSLNLNNPNQRSVFGNYDIRGLEYLYFDTWSLFGYSQFEEKRYQEFLESRGFFDTFGRDGASSNPKILRDFGITKVFTKNEEDGKEEIQTPQYKGYDLIKNEIPLEFLKRESGNIVFKYNSQEDIDIKTRIKHSKNWEVKINGEAVDYSRDGIFFEFNAPKGENLVEIKYIPKPFYLGLQISAMLLIIFVILLLGLKKFSKHEIF